MISKSNIAFRVATFALLAVALGGCTQRQASDAQSTAAPVSQPTAAQPAVATAQPQSATTVAPASNAGIANTEGDKPGTKLVLNSLARGSGDTVTLRFTVVNNSDQSLSMYATFHGSGYNGSGYDVSGVNLIDPVAKKKYFPLADTDMICVCSQSVDNIAAKTQTALWVKFPAPPPSVSKITVAVPHFIPLDGVPITQ
jgi:hypothetical protein